MTVGIYLLIHKARAIRTDNRPDRGRSRVDIYIFNHPWNGFPISDPRFIELEFEKTAHKKSVLPFETTIDLVRSQERQSRHTPG